jgi:hypothetical protein
MRRYYRVLHQASTNDAIMAKMTATCQFDYNYAMYNSNLWVNTVKRAIIQSNA